MKTSQYLLLSFFGFITIATLVLYIDSREAYTLRLAGNPKDYNYSFAGKLIPPVNLESFSVIVADPEAKIQIESDSVNTMSALFFQRDTILKLPEYKILNDTLYVSKSNGSANTIIKCKSVKSIVGKKDSNIYLINFDSDSLLVTLIGSKLNGNIKNKLIGYVEIKANKKSEMYLNQSNINSIKLNIDNSKIYFMGRNDIKTFKAVLTNNAQLQTSKSKKLIIDCDVSSKYSILN
ncbi:hypothetical protein QLS71_005120 [Mariniflexile litorale]|uniref:Auto-transporter adhesin head GIN domain-containing protein n=1 Tax=Mariniflexile litorale TaxID=3045158 RepID=A0AAU7EK33_9FLAO|nr:hypothetical protein [Mariniflexile sp. KMM 9835]MDQ8210955.1 hypothetical protein [Mariniflexile sp. KMM 9835]